MEIDEVPGPMTWIGTVLIIIALNVIQRGYRLKLEQIEVEEEA